MLSSGASVIGVDLGGTKIAIGRFDAALMDVHASTKVDTHAEQEFPHVIEDMIALIQEVREPDTRGVGIGVPGLVKQPEGTILNLPNIPGSADTDLKQQLEDSLSLPVWIENDANCFALAEALHGAGKGHDIVVAITMGTGVGGGIVINGEVYHGATGYAGEIGHMLLKPGEPPFKTKDKRGEVEQFFSGTAMGKRCEEASDPSDYLEGKVCAFMHKSIFEEVAWLCTNLIHVLDPSIIIFGGSAGHALGSHLDQVEDELQKWLLPGTPVPELSIAALDDAATRGAALLVK